MKNNLVRTRYAPSPTGLFHIGGARTALFNYIFAKAYGGSFIVRIEDTDIERNVKDGINSQLKNLAWLKLFPDESLNNPGSYGPYIQSEKLSRYKELANKLLLEDKAYRCFCKSSDLQKQREESLNKGQTPKYSNNPFFFYFWFVFKFISAKILKSSYRFVYIHIISFLW